jgi:hypothetical protein
MHVTMWISDYSFTFIFINFIKYEDTNIVHSKKKTLNRSHLSMDSSFKNEILSYVTYHLMDFD